MFILNVCLRVIHVQFMLKLFADFRKIFLRLYICYFFFEHLLPTPDSLLNILNALLQFLNYYKTLHVAKYYSFKT